MFRITYALSGIEHFIDRFAGDVKHDLDERDRILAEKHPNLGRIYYGGEAFGGLLLEADGTEMRCHALGPTVALLELARACEHLKTGTETYATNSPGGGYGVSLLFEQAGEQLIVKRKSEKSHLLGPPMLETTVEEFNQAMDAFAVWYHTEYLAEASWLLRVEDIQQLRRDAGYPSDHL